MMQWRAADEGNLNRCIRFMDAHEPLCMKAEELFRRRFQTALPHDGGVCCYQLADRETVKALLLCCHHSQAYLSALSPLTEAEFRSFLAIVTRHLSRPDFIHAIPAFSPEQAAALSRALAPVAPLCHRVDFLLMSRPRNAALTGRADGVPAGGGQPQTGDGAPGSGRQPQTGGGENLPPPFRICENDDNDFAQMQTLHALYLREEVANPLRPFPEETARSLALPLLRGKTLWGLYEGTTLISKLNTNAAGRNTLQLGGMITRKEYRNRRFASALLSDTCRRLNREGWDLSLFVKADNRPALRLYRNALFTEISTLTLLYFSPSPDSF